MQYKHLKLLKQMLDKDVEHAKILHYFQLEGYAEQEILGEITTYEQEQALKKETFEPISP